MHRRRSVGWLREVLVYLLMLCAASFALAFVPAPHLQNSSELTGLRKKVVCLDLGQYYCDDTCRVFDFSYYLENHVDFKEQGRCSVSMDNGRQLNPPPEALPSSHRDAYI